MPIRQWSPAASAPGTSSSAQAAGESGTCPAGSPLGSGCRVNMQVYTRALQGFTAFFFCLSGNVVRKGKIQNAGVEKDLTSPGPARVVRS